ncbi:hypothetical protein CDAR_57281 [Caerostris darwini]|uniref:Uncharacterized protein n=1 Tax=Caerostris darwini TaxID=1538125 RepID=A0AAV4TK61_9ARAC|nr:hypothetical protein CDAR_57281 [Caerostris darwini]
MCSFKWFEVKFGKLHTHGLGIIPKKEHEYAWATYRKSSACTDDKRYSTKFSIFRKNSRMEYLPRRFYPAGFHVDRLWLLPSSFANNKLPDLIAHPATRSALSSPRTLAKRLVCTTAWKLRQQENKKNEIIWLSVVIGLAQCE